MSRKSAVAQPLIAQQELVAARARIAPLIRTTPLLYAEALSGRVGAEVYLKLETLQATGSFKVRGAANKLLSLAAEARARGVVAVSTGNHGRAVAYVAKRLGVRATVCLSREVPRNKVAAIEALGARLVIRGDSQDEAEAAARELVEQGGLTLVHPFDDAQVIAGQASLGLELLEQVPGLDAVLVPLSGGGLLAGVALALEAAKPQLRVVGVSQEASPVMIESLSAGRPLELPERATLADSLRGGIGLENRYTFALVRELADETLRVPEAAIAEAMRFLLETEGLLVEGAAAVGVAALLERRLELSEKVAVILSGRNLGLDQLAALLRPEEGAG